MQGSHFFLSLVVLWAAGTIPWAGCDDPVDSATVDQCLNKVEDAEWHLGELTLRIATLTARFEDFMKTEEDSHAEADAIYRRLDRRAGYTGECAFNYFPCSRGVVGGVQCVRDYLVCDGTPDCRNGADERPERCADLPFAEDVVMPTLVTRDICATVPTEQIEAQKPFGWAINAAQVLPWFPSRPRLTWEYIIHIETDVGVVEEAFETGAVYDYATRSLFTDFNPNHFLIGPCLLDFTNKEKSLYVCELQRTQADRVCFISVATLEKQRRPNGRL